MVEAANFTLCLFHIINGQELKLWKSMQLYPVISSYWLAGIKMLGNPCISVRVCHNISIESLSPTRTISAFSHILKLDMPQGNLSKIYLYKINLP